jgi:hypothetical protein
VVTDRDPKIVLQAHSLRVNATCQALLHGTDRVRAARTGGLGGLWVSLALSAVILVMIIVTSRVMTLLSHTGH